MESFVAAAALLLIGVGITLWLRTGRYRRPDEGGPLPRHLWVVPVAPFVAVWVTRALAESPWPAALAHLVLAGAGRALAAIDADVHRLPNAITLPLVPVVLALLTVASATGGEWSSLRQAVLATVLLGGGALLAALLLPGRAIGMGDAKLLLSLTPALAWLSWSHLVVGLWLGVVIAGLQALVLVLLRRATRRSRVAAGPALVAGALLALGIA